MRYAGRRVSERACLLASSRLPGSAPDCTIGPTGSLLDLRRIMDIILSI
jgi:hypothetical protein